MLSDSEIIRRHQRGGTFQIVPPTDWRSMIRTRGNLLVKGPNDLLRAFLQTARPEMREPIRSADAGLPPFLDGVRTLILTDIEALTGTDQQRLLRWFNEDRHHDVQVISLTSVSLFSRVTATAFDASLYYRLNTIVLEIQAA
jgi:hypothetical protein